MTSALSMRAAVLRGDRHFELTRIERPEPGPGELRIRLEACGLCGTDLHALSSGLMAPGHTPGHEMAGRVEKHGQGVTAPAIGRRVAIEPLRSCGHCADCLAGRDSICREVQISGLHGPGGLAEFIVVPARRAFPVAQDMDPHLAALTEPLAVAVHGLSRGGFEKGQRVLVLGSGSVGLMALVAARQLGASEVWTTARHARQAELAHELGAARVLAESEAAPDALDRLGRERDFDLVIESVGGHADTLLAACAAARPGGCVSVLGVFMSSPALAPHWAIMKELSLCWSNCYHRSPDQPADFEVAATILDGERERLAPMLSHRVALAETTAAFELAANRRAGAIKVSVGLEQD